jgi:integrase
VIERVRLSDSMGARALLFMILTATRVSEAREARWSEISFDKALWIIPAERMKRRVEHRVPLSRQALAILAELKTHRTRSPFVFPGNDAREGKTRAIGRMAVWMLCGRVTEGAASPHGFRSTFYDWAADKGIADEVTDVCLAHLVGDKTKRAYLRTTMMDRRRAAMQDWADYACGDGERAADNVVPLRSAV